MKFSNRHCGSSHSVACEYVAIPEHQAWGVVCSRCYEYILGKEIVSENLMQSLDIENNQKSG